MFHPLPVHSFLLKLVSSVAAIASVGYTAAVQLPASAATLTPVNVELSLLVDVSPSIDNREYALQMQGYRDAFIALSSQFGSGDLGSVAVNLIQWAGTNQQQQSIPWTLINDPTSAIQFANTIAALVRPTGFAGTEPGAAIQFAVPLFSNNDYEGQRWVIDVSGDGIGLGATQLARDNALAAGVAVINGLPIVTALNSNLEAWYRNNVQGGAGSFTIPAYGFDDVDRALEQKLRLELTLPTTDIPSTDSASAAVPEPTTLLGIALAGSGLAYLKRRRSA